jgi:hypothetical protein
MLEEVTAVALKRVIAWQIAEEMKAQQLTKAQLAARMHTSRAALNRLLDETDPGLTLTTARQRRSCARPERGYPTRAASRDSQDQQGKKEQTCREETHESRRSSLLLKMEQPTPCPANGGCRKQRTI